MKILRLTTENLKRISVVDIKPDGSLIQITGKNGSGKSSVLDAIFWGLGGPKAVNATQPVRAGEQEARIRLEMGNTEAEIILTRVFDQDGTTSVKVIDASSGAVFPSPQKMLDGLCAKFTFDPLAFALMHARDQLDAMKRLVNLDVDVDSLDAQNKADFDKRTGVNRLVDSLKERVATLFSGVDPTVDVALVDVSALLDEMAEVANYNQAIDNAHSARAGLVRKVEFATDAVRVATDAVANLERELTLARNRLQSEEANLAAIQTNLEQTPLIAEKKDVADLRQRVDEAGRENAAKELQRRQREAHEAAKAELATVVAQAKALTDAMNNRTEQKNAAIARAQMPVPGLSFGDGELLLNGLPFTQASSAEVLRTSVAVAMAMNPKLRVLRIKDGSLLDEDSLAIVAEMAAERDYQVWLERVDSSGAVGIVMEDGRARVAPAVKRITPHS
jgi:DNA repair exonuclease SbcCD ATPase subunit